MAAAAIPLIAAFAPQIISLIAGLVHKRAPIAEATHGPATGPVKFTDVLSDVMLKLQAAAGAGQIPKQLPGDDLIKLVIQSVVTSMKLEGLLGENNIPAVTDSNAIVLAPGQSITISVK